MSKNDYAKCTDDIKFKSINKNGKLKNYLIQSSFASYSITGDNYSTSSIDTLIQNLNLGSRLIHLDINWFMRKEDNKRIPIVTNRHIKYLDFEK